MKTDDVASLATRAAKDHSLIPTADRPVAVEAAEAGLTSWSGRSASASHLRPPTWEEVVAA